MLERRASVDILLAGFGIVYPAIVYFLRGSLDPLLFIVLAVAIVSLRLVLGDFRAGAWRAALVSVAIGLLALAVVDPALAARAYPVLLSIAAASVFAATLVRPPSLIERLALASGEVWSPGLQIYCRNVTFAWALWLCLNAAIAATLTVAGDDRAWALWTGLFSYLVSGVLFAGEWLVRRSFAGR